MENTKADSSQTCTFLHLSTDETRTAIAALSYNLLDSFSSLEYNWDVNAYYGLTNSTKTVINTIESVANRIARVRKLLGRLTTHLDDPTQGTELSNAEIETLGHSLYTYGTHGFHRALRAIQTKIFFHDSQQECRAIDELNRQNKLAFALFKQLEPFSKGKGLPWMVWRQANIEHEFATTS